jgi:BolA protein
MKLSGKTLKGLTYIKMAKMEDIIRQKLTESLNPTHLEVINESHLHAGHAGDNGSGESHFLVKVASPELTGLSRVEGQRRIYLLLADELKTSIHALSINILSG